MKRIVVVEDRPWKVMQSIQTLQKEGVEFCKTIFYPNNLIDKKNILEERLFEKIRSLFNIQNGRYLSYALKRLQRID